MFHQLNAVWKFRHFWMALVRMDLRSRYRRSVLGIGWSVLHPIAMSAVFCLVFSQIMDVQSGNLQHYDAPWKAYAAFLICGMTVWDFIRNSVVVGCNSLISNESYIRQCPLPYSIYPLRTVLGIGTHFLISLGVIVVLVACLQGSFAVFGMLWTVLPVLPLLFLFCWALATIASFATVYFPDTSHLAEVGAQLMFFLTPIIYDRKKLGSAEFLADLNPANLFLELVRTPLAYGEAPDAVLYAQAVVVTAAAVGLAVGTIAWLQKKLIFQL